MSQLSLGFIPWQSCSRDRRLIFTVVNWSAAWRHDKHVCTYRIMYVNDKHFKSCVGNGYNLRLLAKKISYQVIYSSFYFIDAHSVCCQNTSKIYSSVWAIIAAEAGVTGQRNKRGLLELETRREVSELGLTTSYSPKLGSVESRSIAPCHGDPTPLDHPWGHRHSCLFSDACARQKHSILYTVKRETQVVSSQWTLSLWPSIHSRNICHAQHT